MDLNLLFRGSGPKAYHREARIDTPGIGRWRAYLGFCGLVLSLLAARPPLAQADRLALWNIVNGQCVVNELAHRGSAPCAYLDTSSGAATGFAILKDRDGVAQFLLIPTGRITGIEDPAILRSAATNYWDHAWKAHYFVEARLATVLPRDALSLAINSAVGRSQDQLHIHIDCVKPEVRAALHANLDRIGKTWAPFPVPLEGHAYRAIRIDRETLEDINPFRVLADSDPTIAAHMGDHTLVLVGETFTGDRRGFVLLDGRADAATGNRGSGEELQDHGCAVAGPR